MAERSTFHNPGTSPVGGHIPALDGLRGLAILLVFLHHQTLLTGTASLDRGVLAATRLGWCGVDLFFALSGFLITGILYDARGSRGYFRNFYARRALRIFPLYYLVLFVALVLLPRVLHVEWRSLRGALGHEWWYWCYLSNVLLARVGHWGTGVLDVSWSLAIEEQFYLVWPLAVCLCSRRTLLWVCAAAAAAAFLLRCCLLGAGFQPIAVYALTPTRLDGLALGAWVALAARGDQGMAGLRGLALALLPPAAAGLLALVLARHSDLADPWMQTIGYTLLAVLAACGVVAGATAAPGSVLFRFLTCRPLRGLGKYSYAIYLFHMPLCAVLRELVHAPGCFPTVLGSQLPGQVAFYLGTGAVVYAAAWVSWHAFESPILRLKAYFPARGPETVPPVPLPVRVVRGAPPKARRDGREPARPARRPVPVSE